MHVFILEIQTSPLLKKVQEITNLQSLGIHVLIQTQGHE